MNSISSKYAKKNHRCQLRLKNRSSSANKTLNIYKKFYPMDLLYDHYSNINNQTPFFIDIKLTPN